MTISSEASIFGSTSADLRAYPDDVPGILKTPGSILAG
jgi:hypothetical protein